MGVCFAAFVKADADADAALLYGAYGYGGYAAAPYAGLYGGYAAPYAYGYAAGYGVSNVANTVGYAGAGRYVANSAGVVHVAKRSADAEPEADADAALLYGAYGYGGLGYAGYGYGAC